MRFPVFLRSATEHDGSLSPLLHGWSDLRDAARELVREGRDASDLLVVEFCDTSDADGLFRKYGAFVIGERIVPRGMMFSTHWVVKEEDVESPELMREQRDYLETNPHASWIGALARRAGVGYGRVDYALRHGQPQVWEINTNPTVVTARDTVKPADVPLVESMVRPIARALESIDR